MKYIIIDRVDVIINLIMAPFEEVLHSLLARRLLVWSDDGVYIIVKNKRIFEKELGKWFKHSKMSSFVRQLNNYGFSKREGSALMYSNPLFTRDSPGPIISSKKHYISKDTVHTMQETLQDELKSVQKELSELRETIEQERKYYQEMLEQEQRQHQEQLLTMHSRFQEVTSAYNTMSAAYSALLDTASGAISINVLKSDPWMFTES